MGTAAAIVGGSIVGGLIQGKGAKSAAETQAGAAREGISEQRLAREESRALAQPFVDIGVQAGQDIQNLLADPTAGLAQINPIVDFLRNQGFEQIQESAAAQGRLGAGGTLEDLTEFNTQLGATIVPQLQNQRFNQLFNLLSSGQSAAAGQGQQAIQAGSNVGNLLGQAGRATAGGQIGQANALTGGIQNLAGAAGAFPNLFQTAGASIPAGQPVGQQVFGLGNQAGGGGTGAQSTFGL
jgi:hypothetical protein